MAPAGPCYQIFARMPVLPELARCAPGRLRIDSSLSSLHARAFNHTESTVSRLGSTNVPPTERFNIQTEHRPHHSIRESGPGSPSSTITIILQSFAISVRLSLIIHTTPKQRPIDEIRESWHQFMELGGTWWRPIDAHKPRAGFRGREYELNGGEVKGRSGASSMR
jgi:hypothetical protein